MVDRLERYARERRERLSRSIGEMYDYVVRNGGIGIRAFHHPFHPIPSRKRSHDLYDAFPSLPSLHSKRGEPAAKHDTTALLNGELNKQESSSS